MLTSGSYLHPTPNILNPKPCTLRPTPLGNQHPTPHTLNPIPDSLNPHPVRRQVAAGSAMMLPSGARGAAPRFLRLLDATIVSCTGDPSEPDTVIKVAFLRAPGGGAAPPEEEVPRA